MAVTAVMVPVGLALVGAGDPQGGLWYFNDSGMATIHQTTTGQGITIAVLDGPLNPNTPDLAGLDIPTTGACAPEIGGPAMPSTATDESAEHATSMVSVIIGTGRGCERAARCARGGARRDGAPLQRESTTVERLPAPLTRRWTAPRR